MSFKQKNRTLIIGGLVSIIYILLIFISERTLDGLFIVLLYLPGLFFGTGVAITLKNELKESMGIWIVMSLSIAFLITMTYASKDFEILLEFRSKTLGGFGALLSLFIIQTSTNLNFKGTDYLIVLLIGTATTYQEVLNASEIYTLLIAIAVWQIGMFYVINNRQFVENKKVGNNT